MKLNRAWIAAGILSWALTAFGQQTADEDAIWKLEHSYWEYVKAQDVTSYKELWHPNFVGWPSFSAQPQRKDHIADWMTSYAAKGLRLASYTLKPAASQATGQLVVVHYWVTTDWVGKNGSQKETLRITHTWIPGEKGWQIISGMSTREPDKKE